MKKLKLDVSSIGDEVEIWDGYHTFDELYEHRHLLFIALCHVTSVDSSYGYVWRAKLHADGSFLSGWFIMGIGTEPGTQITYHLPERLWDEADVGNIHTRDKAPEWDGHTSSDVLERLKSA